MKKYKSYIILLIIILVNAMVCLYTLKWHSVYKDNELSTTIITDYINEIKKEEFSNYISENPYTVIYFGIPGDANCRNLEKKLKDYIINNNLRETIVYMNVSILDGDDFATKMDDLFNVDTFRKQHQLFDEIPAIAVYNHTTLLNFVSNSNLSIDEVDQLLREYNLIGD
ncbi:MAG: DUF6568 family protein [Bacilli bacterium]